MSGATPEERKAIREAMLQLDPSMTEEHLDREVESYSEGIHTGRYQVGVPKSDAWPHFVFVIQAAVAIAGGSPSWAREWLRKALESMEGQEDWNPMLAPFVSEVKS